jgi:sucrose phosphorylase
MNTDVPSTKSAPPKLPNGVMLNAYPDSIGHSLVDTIDMLKRPEFRDVFSLFYVLPTFFHSDLDRGFSVIDYDRNEELVSDSDLKEIDTLGINLKFDLVLNHLSVGSPQFQDMLEHGDDSQFKDFFVDWNEFWSSQGTMGDDGYVIPKDEHLQKLFMRKPGLPILKVRFPDGSDRPYWNTFYQQVTYQELSPSDLRGLSGLSAEQATAIAGAVNDAIRAKADLNDISLGAQDSYRDDVLSIVERKRRYLGQMDLNARSEGVWDFYDATLKKLHDFGAKLVRLDAFAYLHKEPGKTNFFNKPGTWDYLERLRQMAAKYELILLPEIHAEYGTGLHEEVAGKGFPVYDFFLPGLVIDALDRSTSSALLSWTREILDRGLRTINMLGCHDGIPVLDLKGKEVLGVSKPGLLTDEQIDVVMENVLARRGRVKNLYGPDGKKISYYQVNATYFSALGESEQKLRLARAIQLFMPGIPQVWYLDLFAGTNNYEAADHGGAAGHKEINRTTLTASDIEKGLARSVVQDQLTLMRLRNTSSAFDGELEIGDAEEHLLQMTWRHGSCSASLNADLRSHAFTVTEIDGAGETQKLSFG